MDIDKIFEEKFEKKAQNTFWSPGRVNIIGEHSDYHDGFVLPSAIDLGITWAVSRRDDMQIRGYSEKFDEIGFFDISDTSRVEDFEWMLYFQGVVEVLKKRKCKIGGVDFAIYSTIPIGSGLSSSSSLATGFAFILNELYDLGFDRVEIAKIACEAEWWYGTNGGIMDQFCISNAQKGKAVLLDCRSLEFELIEIPKEIEIVVFETTIRHKQINSPFALRRKQAEEVVKIAQSKFKDKKITKLRDISVEMLEQIQGDIVSKMGEEKGLVAYRRAMHPIKENIRVMQMKEAFAKKDLKRIGEILFRSHESLRNNYEVSCPELDIAVDTAKHFKELVGSRMIGGGFGGCTINVVKKGRAKHFAGNLEEEFRKRTGIKGNAYICKPSEGACLLK